MRPRGFRLRTLRIVVAAAGIMLGAALGLHRRRENFERMAQKYDWPPAPLFMSRPCDREVARAERSVVWLSRWPKSTATTPPTPGSPSRLIRRS
jgi:hypothetical protein